MSYRQLDLKDSRHIAKPIAGLRMLPTEFTARFGIEFSDHDEKDGLGLMKAALIEIDSGKKFGLVHYVMHPEPRGISVWTHEHSPAPASDLKDFMRAFGFTQADFIGVSEDCDE